VVAARNWVYTSCIYANVPISNTDEDNNICDSSANEDSNIRGSTAKRLEIIIKYGIFL
jgi:hypothetical protein